MAKQKFTVSEYGPDAPIDVQPIVNVLTDNYLPYALGTIMSRAIPAIDGLKPVHRHILYTMYKMGLLKGDRTKSSNIVGQTMGYHPHGDMAIYETMVRMTTGNNSLNIPYIDSKGSMGKVDSRDMQFAAHRYTEAKLAPICAEIFEGIDENAVEMVDNYDATKKEPVLLPVKFPTLLVNTAPGIAVGMSSSMPSYNLNGVCMAVIGIVKGIITNEEQLHKVLGPPDFSTGGTIHGTDTSFINLLKTGKGSVILSGTVEMQRGKIMITEVPYSTSIEAIIEDIQKYIKSGELREISDVRDESDIKGTRISIDVKRGSDMNEVLKKLYKYTRLRTSMGINNTVLIDNKPVQLGILDTLKEWIKFRMNTIDRIAGYRLDKALKQEELLKAWELVAPSVTDAVAIITQNDEGVAKSKLMAAFRMNETQADYLLDMRAKDFTTGRVANRLRDLAETRKNIQHYRDVVASQEEKASIIVEDLTAIINKYGQERRTQVSDLPINEKIEAVVDTRECYVYWTKNGYIKRIENVRNKGLGVMAEEECYQDDKVVGRCMTNNNDYILVFMYDGTVHKIHNIDIDSSKGLAKQSIASLIESEDPILHIMSADGFTKTLYIMYSNGRGAAIHTSRFSGRRHKYVSAYDAGEPKYMFCTEENSMFLITKQLRAVYTKIYPMMSSSGKSVFRVARVPSGDFVIGVQPESKVPNFSEVPLDVYKKDYFVKIKHELW